MNNMVNVSLSVPQSDVDFLNKLVEKMGWGMTQSQAKASSPTDKVERAYSCQRTFIMPIKQNCGVHPGGDCVITAVGI